MNLLEQEVASQLPKTTFTRRGFVVTALGSGFAAAVLPVGAQTITTDTAGLDAGEVKIPVADGRCPPIARMPAGKTNLPTVIVIQEIFGVHEHIKDLCRRLAKAGLPGRRAGAVRAPGRPGEVHRHPRAGHQGRARRCPTRR